MGLEVKINKQSALFLEVKRENYKIKKYQTCKNSVLKHSSAINITNSSIG